MNRRKRRYAVCSQFIIAAEAGATHEFAGVM
jgi:hypothetical protein